MGCMIITVLYLNNPKPICLWRWLILRVKSEVPIWKKVVAERRAYWLEKK